MDQKISNVIEEEFCDVILPNIEAAIQMTVTQFPEEALANLTITESPGGGVSEKIFHITMPRRKRMSSDFMLDGTSLL